MLQSMGIGFAHKKWAKAAVFALVSFALAFGVFLSPQVAKDAKAYNGCTAGSSFQRIHRGGSYHWRVVFNMARPVDTKVENWVIVKSGGTGGSFWPDSFTENYGKAYVYFKWPAYKYPEGSPWWYVICRR